MAYNTWYYRKLLGCKVRQRVYLRVGTVEDKTER